MAELKADVLVLGAGMVGVSAALHLQQRGRDVILIDRHGRAGEETSYGNAGLIECASVFPYMFPRDWRQVLRYAQNRSTDMRFHVSALPVVMPWLLKYFLASSPEGALRSARAAFPLIQRSLIEHESLIVHAGVPDLLRKTGWIKLFRTEASMAKSLVELDKVRQFGIDGDVLDAAGIAGAGTKFERRLFRCDPLAVAGIHSRSRRARQSLCRSVRAQWWTLRRGGCAHARTIPRRLARRDARGWRQWPRGRGRARSLV